MITFLLTLVFLLCVVAAMAVGVIFSSRPIKGSCGGIQALGLGGKCEICGDDMEKCEEESARRATMADPFDSTSQVDYYNAAPDSSRD